MLIIGDGTMNDQLVIKNHEGKDQLINVMDIVLDNETGKKYIFYTMDELDDVYAAILIENENSFIIQAITDEEELALVEEILKNQVTIEGVSNGE